MAEEPTDKPTEQKETVERPAPEWKTNSQKVSEAGPDDLVYYKDGQLVVEKTKKKKDGKHK